MPKTILLLCAFYLFAGSLTSHAQTNRFNYAKYTNGKGDTLQYRLLTPDYDTLRSYPLVIFLHGSGERGTDNEAQLKWGVLNFASDQMMMAHPAFVLAPQCPPNKTWENSTRNRTAKEIHQLPDESKPMELLMALIHQLIQQNRIDTNRIYITGLSMGGFGTFDAIERYPQLFAAAVPVCGGGDITKASTIAQIPLWIFHGAEDAAVDPAYSISMAAALIKAGAHPGLTVYPETGHFSWLGAYSDLLMYEWLFRQRRR